MTRLHAAAYHDDVPVVRALALAGADLNAPGLGGSTPLHLAAQQSSLGAAAALLDAGALVDPVDEEGKTPLHVAVFKARADDPMIALLRERGADPFHEDYSGRSPLAWAQMFADRSAAHCFDDLPTAQERYKALLRDHVSPRFRSMGLRGGSGRYSLLVEGGWALIGFEKWKYSDRTEVQFRVNLFAVSRAAWEAYSRGENTRPSAIVGEGYYQLDSRSACLGEYDLAQTWWTLTPIVDIAALGESLGTAMELHGLPWMRRCIAEW